MSCSLFDNDQVTRAARGQYLGRSAQILRETVTPPLPVSVNEIDRHIRLVLTLHGPEFWRLSTIVTCESARRVRNLYYTLDFANLAFWELLLCHAKCKAAPRLTYHMFVVRLISQVAL